MKHLKIWSALCAAIFCLNLTSCDLLEVPEEVGILGPTPEDFNKFIYGKWKCVKAGLYTTEDHEGNLHPDDDPDYGVEGYALESITFSADKVQFHFSSPVLIKDDFDDQPDSHTTEFVCDMSNSFYGCCFSPYVLGYDYEYGEHISHPYYYDNDGPHDYARNWGKITLYGVEDDEIERVDYMLFYANNDKLVYELKKVK